MIRKTRFQAFSAGTHPRRDVHPLTLEVLARQGYDVRGLRSKSWKEVAAPDGPPRPKQLAAFSNAMFQIANRIRLFLSLPIDKVDPMSLQKQLGELNLPSDS